MRTSDCRKMVCNNGICLHGQPGMWRRNRKAAAFEGGSRRKHFQKNKGMICDTGPVPAVVCRNTKRNVVPLRIFLKAKARLLIINIIVDMKN